MDNKLLPIGSIIKMQESDLLFMICGYVDKNKKIDDKFYKYFGCIYPMGINGKESILINEEKIEKVIFIGYQDSKFANFVDLLNKQ